MKDHDPEVATRSRRIGVAGTPLLRVPLLELLAPFALDVVDLGDGDAGSGSEQPAGGDEGPAAREPDLTRVGVLVTCVSGLLPWPEWQRRLARRARAAGAATTHVALNEQRQLVRVGPTVIDEKSPCAGCAETRFRTHLASRDAYDAYARGTIRRRPPRDVEWAANLAATLAALELMRLVDGGGPLVGHGAVYEVELGALSNRTERLSLVPRCPAHGVHP